MPEEVIKIPAQQYIVSTQQGLGVLGTDKKMGFVSLGVTAGLSHIQKSDIVNVSTTELHQVNHHNIDDGDGVLTMLPSPTKEQEVKVIVQSSGRVLLVGEQTNRYSLDQATGNLIYTHP